MSMLSVIGKGLRGAAGGLLAGGPGGAIAGFAGGILGRTGGTTMPVPSFGGGGPGFHLPNLPGVPTVYGPGGIPLPGFGGGGGKATSCPRGYHLNKHPLAPSKRHGAVPAHSMCVRNRSMNPMNYRALTRSLRRVKRAGKIVAKLHHFNAPHRRIAPARAVSLSENLRITSGK